EALQEQGGDVIYYPLDVTSQKSILRLRDFTVRRFGAADILVNNAGIYLDEGSNVLEVGIDIFRITMETNAYGPLMMCQAFIPLMIEQNYGRVVNVSSGAGQWDANMV